MTEKKPAWPSIEDQVAEARPTPGSALDKLIRDNQDFSVLRPDEAEDNIKLPLWLRVYWRKQHPDLHFSTVDPLGAYPDVLFNIYRWMLAHHDLPWGSTTDPTGKRTGSRKGGRS